MNGIAFYNTLSVEDAIKYACDYGKIKVGDKWLENSHFEKLNKPGLQETEVKLLRIKDKLSKANNFQEVYASARAVTETIKGLNCMFYYDCSLRIAASLGKECFPLMFFTKGEQN